MTEAKHTPGPWFVGGYIHDEEDPESYPEWVVQRATPAGDMSIAVAIHVPNPEMHKANTSLLASAPDLLAYVKRKAESAEQREFEDWLSKNRPSGDETEVQRQWEESSEYSDFCDEWSVELELISKATVST